MSNDVGLWKINKTTIRFLNRVQELKSNTRNMILDGNIINNPDFKIMYSKLIGKLEALEQITDLDLMLNNESDDEEED